MSELPGGEPLGTGGWILRRWLPTLALALAAGAAAALLRLEVCFAPGVTGMLFLGYAGYRAGRLGKDDPPELQTFGQRGATAVAMSLLYGFAMIVGLSAARSAPWGDPFDWAADLADGRGGEAFFGLGTYRAHLGVLKGGWWIFFNLLDLALGGVLCLLGIGIGLGSRAPATRICPSCRAPAAGDAAFCSGCGASLATAAEAGSPVAGSRAALLGLFALLLGGGLLGALWNHLQTASDKVAVLSTANLERCKPLLGLWEIRPGEANPELFRFRQLTMDEAAARPETGASFLLRLGPRAGGGFIGQLETGSGFRWFAVMDLFGIRLGTPVRAALSEDGKTPRIVCKLDPGRYRVFEARRPAGAPSAEATP